MSYYNPEYVKTNWKNEEEALSTPVIAESLNNAEKYIEILDQRVSALSHNKAEEEDVEQAIDQIEIKPSGIMTLRRLDGTTKDLYFYMLVPTMENVKDAFDEALENLQETSDDIISDWRSEVEESDERIMEHVERAKSWANNAEYYKDIASVYSDYSRSWAVGSDSIRPGSSIDNAKYYAEQAKSVSEELTGTLRPKGTVYFSNLPALSSAKEGDMYNIANQFTTTSDFKEGAGVVVPEGSNVYKTSDNKWDVLAGSPVTGVKGQKETAYRKGNVNLTPENIGALSIEGGRLTGDLKLQGPDDEYYGRKLLFGDGENAYIGEIGEDDYITVYGASGVIVESADILLKSQGGAVVIKNTDANEVNPNYVTLMDSDGKSAFPSTINSYVNTTTYLNGNRGNAIINSLATPNSYVMLDKLNSTNGYFTDGVYQGKRIFNYTDKNIVNANTNGVTRSLTILDESGNSQFPGTVTAPTFSGSLSGDADRAVKIKDSVSGGDITVTYAKAGQNSTSWIASWNGMELGAIAPSKLKVGNAEALDGKTADYFLPTSGGTITGDLRLKGSTNFGRKLNFGDGEYVYLYEYEDDKLEIKASTLKITSSNNIQCNKPIAADITGNAAGLSATLPISKGGTGATTAEQARANLGITVGGASINTVLKNGDFDTIKTPGFYTIINASHQPDIDEAYGWGLIVVSTAAHPITLELEKWELYQIAFLNNSYTTPNVFVRCFSDGNIGDWYKFNLTKA